MAESSLAPRCASTGDARSAQTERRSMASRCRYADKLVSLFDAYRHHRQGQSRGPVRPQAELEHRQDRPGDRGRQADTDRFQPMLDRHIEHYGKAPRQSAADGGYASTANLAQAKALGVRDVAFHKKRGLAIEDMVKSRWVYRKLRNFRAGIEANASNATGSAAAPGKAWITSRPTSGPRSWPTISPCSPASSRPSSTVSADAGHRAAPGPKACR